MWLFLFSRCVKTEWNQCSRDGILYGSISTALQLMLTQIKGLILDFYFTFLIIL